MWLCACDCVFDCVFVVVVVVVCLWLCLWLCAVVEVRQGGPAGNTGRGWSWLRSDEEEKKKEEEEKEKLTNIKSNNPYLIGGE